MLKKIIIFVLCMHTIPVWGLSNWFHERKARDAYDTSDFVTARKIYELQVEENPEDYGALYNLGKTLYKLQDFNNAHISFETVAKAPEPQIETQLREQALFGAGDSLIQISQLDQARAQFEEILRINPNNTHAKQRLELIKKLQENKKQEDQKQEQEQEKSENSKQEKDKKNNGSNEKQTGESKTQKPDNGQQENTKDRSKQTENNKKTEHDNRTDHDKKSTGKDSQGQDRNSKKEQEKEKSSKHNKTSQESAESSSQDTPKGKKQQLPVKQSRQEDEKQAKLSAEEKQMLELVNKADENAYRGLINQQIKQQAAMGDDEQYTW